MYEYRTVEILTEEGATTYGIELFMNGRPLGRLSSVYPDRGKMEQIAAICTKEQVEPVHVPDVVYDMAATAAL